MVSRSSREPLVQHFALNVFQCGFRNDFFTICDRFGFQKGSLGKAHEGPTNQLFRHFFDSAPWGGPLGRPGSPNDAQGHQNDTKMTPKCPKMTPTTKMTPSILLKRHPYNKKNNNKNIEKFQTNIQQPITVSGHGEGFAAGSLIYICIYTYIFHSCAPYIPCIFH